MFRKIFKFGVATGILNQVMKSNKVKRLFRAKGRRSSDTQMYNHPNKDVHVS